MDAISLHNDYGNTEALTGNSSARYLAIERRDPAPARVPACETLTGPDLEAFNTFEASRTSPPPDSRPGRHGASVLDCAP